MLFFVNKGFQFPKCKYKILFNAFMYVCMYDPLFTRKFFTDASLIDVQLVSMRGVGIIRRTIYKNISNYKTIYKRIGVTLLAHKGNVNIHVIIEFCCIAVIAVLSYML